MIKACRECGELFKIKWPSQHYCNKDCAEIGHRNNIKRLVNKNRVKHKVYMREKARERRAKLLAAKIVVNEKVLEIKLCKVCGEKFERKHRAQTICSKDCRDKQISVKKAIYFQQNKEKRTEYNRRYYYEITKKKEKDFSAYHRKYYLKNKEAIRAYQLQYRLRKKQENEIQGL